MKLHILAVLALCSFAFGAIDIQNNLEDSIVADIGPQEFQLHHASDVVTDEDQQLSDSLRGTERNVVANAINNALESFRDVVINGNDVLPPLDPFIIDQVGPFEVTATGVRVSGQLRNFKMDGLRWYIVNHVTFSTLRLALGVKITVPWITVTGAYDASARIALISHQAGGNFRVFINRLETSVDVRVGTNILGGGTLILRELDILINIHDININIEGLVGSSLLNGIINTFVQNAAQNLLRDELAAFSQLLSQELFDTVNDFLANFTLDDLLNPGSQFQY